MAPPEAPSITETDTTVAVGAAAPAAKVTVRVVAICRLPVTAALVIVALVLAPGWWLTDQEVGVKLWVAVSIWPNNVQMSVSGTYLAFLA